MSEKKSVYDDKLMSELCISFQKHFLLYHFILKNWMVSFMLLLVKKNIFASSKKKKKFPCNLYIDLPCKLAVYDDKLMSELCISFQKHFQTRDLICSAFNLYGYIPWWKEFVVEQWNGAEFKMSEKMSQ
jgi:hypothetical protein